MQPSELNFELMTLAHMMLRKFSKKVEKLYGEEISGMAARIILHISSKKENDVFQRDLEEHFNVRPSTMSANLNQLEKKGFIKRQAMEHDARLKKIILTEKSMHIQEIAEQMRLEMLKQTESVLSPEEIQQMHRFIQKLKKSFEE